MYVVVFSLHDNLSNVMTTKSIHDVVAGIALFFSNQHQRLYIYRKARYQDEAFWG